VTIARRLGCIALQAALLTLSLVGSGNACDWPRAAQRSDSHMRDMPGMPMRAPGEQEDGGSSQKPDCSSPWAPGGCSLMVSCVPNSIGVVSRAVVPSSLQVRDEPYRFAKELRSITRSPEPPPPKA